MTNKVKVVAWLGVIEHKREMVLFADGKVLEGIGLHQRQAATPPVTTIGALRDEWGDASVGLGLPPDTPAWVYGGDDESAATFVVVELEL
jgi:hypothetical protein